MRAIVIVLCLLIAGPVYGAVGTCTVTQESPQDTNLEYKFTAKIVTVACTASADAATYPNTNLPDVTFYMLYQIEYQNGSTGPTDDSDLTLLTANSTDLLGGNGTDFIDNSASAYIIPESTGDDPHYPMITGTITQVIANNAVNSATFTLKYVFIRSF